MCRLNLGNKLRRQITPCVQVWRLVAATCCGDTSQRQIASCVNCGNFVKIFVSATKFCRRNKSHKFCLILFFATCCCNKILLQRHRFSQKLSSTHKAICRCDVSSRHVAATSHLVYQTLAKTSGFFFL